MPTYVMLLLTLFLVIAPALVRRLGLFGRHARAIRWTAAALVCGLALAASAGFLDGAALLAQSDSPPAASGSAVATADTAAPPAEAEPAASSEAAPTAGEQNATGPAATDAPAPVAEQQPQEQVEQPAAAEAAAYDIRSEGWLKVLVAVLVIVGAIGLGAVLAKAWRVPDYQTRITVILFTVFAGIAILIMGFPPRFGIDLRGGVILVYEVHPEETTAMQVGEVPADGDRPVSAAGKVDMGALIAAVSRRVNPAGVKEVTIREYGQNQIEIIVPEADEAEVERLKRIISTVGALEFRILANERDHRSQIQRAREVKGSVVPGPDGKPIGWWVPVAKGKESSFPYSEIATRPGKRGNEEFLEIFVVSDPWNVTGQYLTSARKGNDAQGRLAVDFSFDDEGAHKFGSLTSENLPDKVQDFSRKLGIILDGYLHSAPGIQSTIRDRGQITGDFTQAEIDELVEVLNAGKLPAALSQEPISQLYTGPTLGADTIRSGTISVVVSMVLVVIFILVYYRFSGIVACVALALNIALTLAMMIVIKAPLTLPGLAGLVLTIGMAVDANVLIYERMREELERNATLRMAIRNGFVRAWSAIFDSNITTIMTAVILYVIGTDQIRGFAVTLFLGLAISMYTAIYMARTIFDIADRRKVITDLKMLKMLSKTNIDFLSMRWPAITASLILIVIGLAAVFTRGQGLLDIDFTGGVSVEAYFRQPKDISVIRSQLADLPDLVVYGLHSRTDGPNRHFVINTSILPNMDAEAYLQQVQDTIAQTFGDELVRYKVDVSVLESQPAQSTSPPSAAPPPNQQGRRNDLPADNLLASADPSALWMSQAAIAAEPVAEGETAGESAPEAGDSPEPQPSSESGADAPAADSGQMAEGAAPEPALADMPAPANGAAPAAESEKEAQAEEAAPPETAQQTAEMAPEQPAADQAAPAAEQPAVDESVPAAEPTATEQSPPVAGSAPEAAPAQETTNQASEMPAEQPAAEPPAAAPTAEPPASPPDQPSGDAAAPSQPQGEPAAEAPTPPTGPMTTAKLSFEREHRYETVADMIHQIINRGDVVSQATTFDLTSEDYQPDEDRGLREWTVTLHAPADEAHKLLDALKRETNEKVYFPAANTIGGAVAASTRRDAAAAVLASLVAIIAYLWVRFQKVMYGLAAAVALVHDVLVTLGLLALSKYLVDLPVVGAFFSNVLLMDPFKIGLSSLAAFLTIIGYSLNDTIVIFDRIREIKGKSPRLTEATINLAVNQTLSRTILTALTSFFVVIVLYVGGGPTIHAFSFAMVIGVIAGSYSTVFMAGPVLIWLGSPGGTPQSPKPAEKAKV